MKEYFFDEDDDYDDDNDIVLILMIYNGIRKIILIYVSCVIENCFYMFSRLNRIDCEV